MTPKQERFCKEYVRDYNATQAAIRAGYNPKTAAVIANQNLKKLYIQQKIQELSKPIDDDINELRRRIINELKIIAFVDACEFTTGDPESWDKERRRAISGISYNQFGRKLNFHDKTKALEMLTRHTGMFIDSGNANKTESFDVIEETLE